MGIASLKQRQVHQAKRIAEGVKSGELTKVEARKASADLRAVHRQIVKDRIDGGGLTPKEWAKDQLLLNRTSREIYQLKHN